MTEWESSASVEFVSGSKMSLKHDQAPRWTLSRPLLGCLPTFSANKRNLRRKADLPVLGSAAAAV